MFGFGKREAGLGIAGAVALAACSPEQSQNETGLGTPEAASVMKDAGDGNIEITLPQETVAEPTADTPEGRELARKEAIESGQYTAEELDIIESGTTKEVDE